MSSAKSYSYDGSLFKKKVQPSLITDNKPLRDNLEFIVPKDASEVFEIVDAAKFLGVAVRTLRQYVLDGRIPCIRYSRKKRVFLKTNLVSFMKKHHITYEPE